MLTPFPSYICYRIDIGIHVLPASTRSCVFSHLAAYLPVGKATLVARAKKLRQLEHDKHESDLQHKLRPALESLAIG